MHMRTPPHLLFIKDKQFQSYPDDVYGDYKRLMAAPEEARQAFMTGLYDENRPNECPCSWLDPDTRQCRWYEFRPNVCRAFELGSDNCHRARRRQGIDPPTVFRIMNGKLHKVST